MTSEVLGMDPGASRRRKIRWLSVTAVLGALGVLGATLWDHYMIQPNVARENESNKKYDAAQQPFTVSVRPDEDEPEAWAVVLDRELTAAEARRLAAGDRSAAFAYLKRLGGHPLAHASFLENAPERYMRQGSSSGGMELSDTFKMNVLSTRSHTVVINDWKVTGLTCRKSTAKTVVFHPLQGGVTYQGIRLHLPPWAGEPVLTDDTEGQGEPYFATRYIEVGGGQPSGGLRVEAIAPRGQSCEWGIEVHYSDVHQPGRWVRLKDGNGKPLRIRTESVPANPRQKWVFGAVPWTPCHRKPEESMCDML
ncbi:hypothetical protein [Streptomyces atacamensis]|uniref:hypothetical protein n=1 Tax=Streptomyces atacamensis TaxID=531966 RepID=UPI00399D555C